MSYREETTKWGPKYGIKFLWQQQAKIIYFLRGSHAKWHYMVSTNYMFYADMMSNHMSILKDGLVQELMQVSDMKLFRKIIFHLGTSY